MPCDKKYKSFSWERQRCAIFDCLLKLKLPLEPLHWQDFCVMKRYVENLENRKTRTHVHVHAHSHTHTARVQTLPPADFSWDLHPSSGGWSSWQLQRVGVICVVSTFICKTVSLASAVHELMFAPVLRSVWLRCKCVRPSVCVSVSFQSLSRLSPHCSSVNDSFVSSATGSDKQLQLYVLCENFVPHTFSMN